MELPLTHPEYYEEMGIKPPKGVILYGAPGTGMTLYYCDFMWCTLGTSHTKYNDATYIGPA